MRVSGRAAFTDETLRMAPCFRSAIDRANTCVGSSVPSRLRLVTVCKASRGRSKKRWSGLVVAFGSLPPAPLRRMSIFSCSPSTILAASSSAGRSSTSALMARCRPLLDFENVAIVASARSTLRPSNTTFALQTASARAISLPRTPVPPVTNAVCDLVAGETEVLSQRLVRRRGAEAVHPQEQQRLPKNVTPTLLDPGFDHGDLCLPRDDGVPDRVRLSREAFATRHRDNPHGQRGREQLGGRDRDLHL